MRQATPEQRLIRDLEAALRQFDEENASAPDAHATDCACELCAFVAALREALAGGAH